MIENLIFRKAIFKEKIYILETIFQKLNYLFDKPYFGIEILISKIFHF